MDDHSSCQIDFTRSVLTNAFWESIESHMLADAAGPLAEVIQLFRAHEVVLQGLGVGVQGGCEPLQAAVLRQHLQPVSAASGIPEDDFKTLAEHFQLDVYSLTRNAPVAWNQLASTLRRSSAMCLSNG